MIKLKIEHGKGTCDSEGALKKQHLHVFTEKFADALIKLMGSKIVSDEDPTTNPRVEVICVQPRVKTGGEESRKSERKNNSLSGHEDLMEKYAYNKSDENEKIAKLLNM